MIREKIREVRDMVWGMDVPNSTIPEYIEWHENCQTICKALDNILQIEETPSLIDLVDKMLWDIANEYENETELEPYISDVREYMRKVDMSEKI